MPNSSEALIPSVNVNALVDVYLETVEGIRVGCDAFEASLNGLEVLVGHQLGSLTVRSPTIQTYHSRGMPQVREELEHTAFKAFWHSVVSRTNLASTLSEKKIREVLEQIDRLDMPEPSVENVYALLHAYREQRQDMFRESLEGIYHSLSQRHRTNDPIKFTPKMILRGLAQVQYYRDYQNVRRIHCSLDHGVAWVLDDLSKAIAVLNGDPVPDRVTFGWNRRLTEAVTTGDWEAQDGYLRVKVFKAGTGHVWILDPAVIDKLNVALGHEPSLGFRDPNRPSSGKKR